MNMTVGKYNIDSEDLKLMLEYLKTKNIQR